VPEQANNHKHVGSLHIASFRGIAPIRSLSDRSGHSASRPASLRFQSYKVKVFGPCGVMHCQVARPVTGITGRTVAALGVPLRDPPTRPLIPRHPCNSHMPPAVTQPWLWIRFSCRGLFGSCPNIKRMGESANAIERRRWPSSPLSVILRERFTAQDKVQPGNVSA